MSYFIPQVSCYKQRLAHRGSNPWTGTLKLTRLLPRSKFWLSETLRKTEIRKYTSISTQSQEETLQTYLLTIRYRTYRYNV